MPKAKTEYNIGDILMDYALRVSEIDHEADDWEVNPADGHEMHSKARKETSNKIQHLMDKAIIRALDYELQAYEATGNIDHLRVSVEAGKLGLKISRGEST